jgi:hypothetical protein
MSAATSAATALARPAPDAAIGGAKNAWARAIHS